MPRGRRTYSEVKKAVDNQSGAMRAVKAIKKSCVKDASRTQPAERRVLEFCSFVATEFLPQSFGFQMP